MIPTLHQFDDVGLLKSVNSFKMEKKQLKIKSFYLFHLCQLNCVRDINNKDSESCFRKCEFDLDQYFTFKKENRFDKLVYYSLPRYKQGGQYIIPEDQQQDYQKKCLEFEIKAEQNLKILNKFLNDRNEQYTSEQNKKNSTKK